MSDVFLSYDSVDRRRAQLLAEVIEQQGVSVWWDRIIHPGETWDEVIERELDVAKVVIVLWSSASIDSEWVRAEALEAAERRILVPAVIEPDLRIPIRFRRIQAADLVDWQGSVHHPGVAGMFRSLENLLGMSLAHPLKEPRSGSTRVERVLEEELDEPSPGASPTEPPELPEPETTSGQDVEDISRRSAPSPLERSPVTPPRSLTPVREATAASQVGEGSFRDVYARMLGTAKNEWRKVLIWLGLTGGGAILSLGLLILLTGLLGGEPTFMGSGAKTNTFLLSVFGGVTIGAVQWLWLRQRAGVGPAWIGWSAVVLASSGYLCWYWEPVARIGLSHDGARAFNLVFFRVLAVEGLLYAGAIAVVQGRLMQQARTIWPSVFLQALPWLVAELVSMLFSVPTSEKGIEIGLPATIALWTLLNGIVVSSYVRSGPASPTGTPP